MQRQKEGRITEANVRSAGTSQDTVSDLRELERRLWHFLVACSKGEANNFVCNTGRSRSLEADGQSLWSKSGCGQICRVLEGDTPGESEWNNTNEADGIGGCTNHDASLRTGTGRIRVRQKGWTQRFLR